MRFTLCDLIERSTCRLLLRSDHHRSCFSSALAGACADLPGLFAAVQGSGISSGYTCGQWPNPQRGSDTVLIALISAALSIPLSCGMKGAFAAAADAWRRAATGGGATAAAAPSAAAAGGRWLEAPRTALGGIFVYILGGVRGWRFAATSNAAGAGALVRRLVRRSPAGSRLGPLGYLGSVPSDFTFTALRLCGLSGAPASFGAAGAGGDVDADAAQECAAAAAAEGRLRTAFAVVAVHAVWGAMLFVIFGAHSL